MEIDGVPVQECINCGYCCRKTPCPFGEVEGEIDTAIGAMNPCRHLTEDNMCGIYDQIIGQPGAELSPAFGAGCSSVLNGDRQNLLRSSRKS